MGMISMTPSDTSFRVYIAALLTSVSFVPQAIRTLRTQDTQGISTGMYVTFVAGTATWLWYGIALRSLPVVASSIVTLLLSAMILVMKLRCGQIGRASCRERVCQYV